MPAAQIALLVGGVFIADRVNKMPLVLAFLGVYYLLFTVTASFVSDPAWVSEVFRAPDLQAVLFFALFILTDPPTSPVKYRTDHLCGDCRRRQRRVFEWLARSITCSRVCSSVTSGRPGDACTAEAGCAFPRGIGVFAEKSAPGESAATVMTLLQLQFRLR